MVIVKKNCNLRLSNSCMNACMQPENAVLSFITCVRGLGCACLSLRFPDTYFTFLSPHVHFQVPIGRAEEVEEVFDAISYCKGASVVSANKGAMGGWVETVAVEGWASLLLQPGKSCSASAFISFHFGLAFIFHFLAPPPPWKPCPVGFDRTITHTFFNTHTHYNPCATCHQVRMLHCVLGKEAFQQGLQLYMERHQYGNTETFHLWRAWEEVSGKPISQVLDLT